MAEHDQSVSIRRHEAPINRSPTSINPFISTSYLFGMEVAIELLAPLSGRRQQQ
jgi:hypothetical protein